MMEDKNIKSKLKDTFNSEVPDVLSSIKASPDFRIPTKEEGFSLRNILNRRLVFTFTSIIVIALIFSVGFARNNLVIASTVTMELNPTIEISLNRQDYVVKVTAINDDGDEVIERDVTYRGLTIDEALEILVERLNELGYVVDTDDVNNIILIEVDGKSEAIKERIQTAFETKLQYELEKYNKSHWVFDQDDFELTDEQLRLIKNHELLEKMSATKLALVFRINTLEPSYSLATLARTSLRDLYDLYITLEEDDNLPNRSNMPDPKNNQGQPFTHSSEIVSY